jgi:SWI/SNF-related matrix-associated actin-dependent regulator of chromatin subfamily A protein 2/4
VKHHGFAALPWLQVEDVESKLPPKVPVVVKVAPSPYQSCIYSWIKASGTIRLDPSAPFLGKFRREFASLNNKCMELRKASFAAEP